MFPMHAASIALALFAAQDTTADRWDQAELEALTEEIRRELEDLRGEEFLGPVKVRVTDGVGFLQHAKERVETFTTEDDWVADERRAKMLGLIPPEMDLLATTYDLLESQVGGFYDPAADTFYLMEDYTGGLAKVILSHELVHALDDQLFDLDAGMKARAGSDDALFAYQAVCEGSGQLISTRWVMRNAGVLTAEDLEKAGLGTESLADAPTYLWKPLMGAYLAGNTFLDRGYRYLRREDRKTASHGLAIRRAFEAPPLSSEQVLHPEKYWSAEERDDPVTVRHGEAPEGWTEVSRTTLGELLLAIVVDEADGPDWADRTSLLRIDYTNAAASGWGGDEVVLYTRADGGAALHLATVWDTAEDAREFHAALERVRPRLEASLAATAALDAGADAATMSALRLSIDDERRSVEFAAVTGADDAAVDALLAAIAWSTAD